DTIYVDSFYITAPARGCRIVSRFAGSPFRSQRPAVSSMSNTISMGRRAPIRAIAGGQGGSRGGLGLNAPCSGISRASKGGIDMRVRLFRHALIRNLVFVLAALTAAQGLLVASARSTAAAATTHGRSTHCHLTDGTFGTCPDGSAEWSDVAPSQ